MRALVCTLLAACTFPEPEDIPFSQTSIAIVSGDPQEGIAGSQLAESLVVKVTDADFQPLSNFTVEFVVVEGAGELAENAVRTDAQGNASTMLRLGPRVGPNVVEASGEGIEGEPAVFSSLGLVGDVARVAKISGDLGTGVVASELAPFVVRAEDEHGNPVADRPVVFALVGDGALSTTSATTNEAGEASTTLTLDTLVGATATTAVIDGASATFEVLARADAPASMTGSGGGQLGTALVPLAPFVVTIVDQHGNPTPGIGVTFTRIEGAGTLDVASAVTGDNGQAQVIVTPSNLDEVNRVRVDAGALTPVELAATTRGFRPALQISASTSDNYVAGDIDNDGRTDFVGSSGTSDVRVFMNRITSFPRTTVSNINDESFTLADIDGDNRDDLAYSKFNGDMEIRLSTSLPNATPTFAVAQTIALPDNITTVAFGDLDGDDKPDLVYGFTSFSDSGVRVARNTSSGATASFATPITIATSTTANRIVLADLNGDDKLDVAVGGKVIPNTTVTTISFGPPVTFAFSSQFAVGDLDGDGLPELVSREGSSIRVARNITSSPAQPPMFAAGVNVVLDTRSFTVGDFNGDGNVDLATTDNQGELDVRLSTSSATTLAFTAPFLVDSDPDDVIAIELTNDGKTDLIGNPGNNQIRIYLTE